ncbi:MAG: alpha/beta hydrolase [Chlorobiaceae bacterium]|jgi:esterase/lipase superfamily enzyme|nr:alpha/beta hydrolase [Chlorobiaceae bacterium]NTW63151.1 alpha/beta hydrolase [Chlorobiaceae bacterium]
MRFQWRFVSSLVLLVLFSGCTTTSSLVQRQTIRVFYATDRAVNEPSSDHSELYGGERGAVTYGVCDVGIPQGHGSAEPDMKFCREPDRKNPDSDAELQGVNLRSETDFFSELDQRIKGSPSHSLLLFVHGYNLTFEKAARNTALFFCDLGFNGTPLFFSWPSQGAMGKYTIDETNIEWSQTNLKQFLEALARRSGAEDIYLMAHSMGNRALTKALAELLHEQPQLKNLFKALILVAPDIDAEIFKRDIAPKLTDTGTFVTLYASCDDKALKLSTDIHGYMRAGDISKSSLIVPGVEIIDATNVDTGFLGHSYYKRSRQVLSDLSFLINMGVHAGQRRELESVDTSSGRFWKFRKEMRDSDPVLSR